MPTYFPLTKQDLLQRLKEQEEAHKQRRLDILQRVKLLEARKKYVKELKSWMERRKLTATDLLAMYRELMPKRGPRPVRSKNALQPHRKSASEQLVDAMREKRIAEIDVPGVHEIVASLGYAKRSYSHIVNSAVGAGLLRRGDRDGNGWKYVVTGGAPPAKRLHANLGRIAKPIMIKGPGDPAFCKAIREARLAKGWSHAELGKRIATSGASVHSWEHGRFTPKEAARQKVVKLLGLPGDLGAAATAASKAREGGRGHSRSANGHAPSP